MRVADQEEVELATVYSDAQPQSHRSGLGLEGTHLAQRAAHLQCSGATPHLMGLAMEEQ